MDVPFFSTYTKTHIFADSFNSKKGFGFFSALALLSKRNKREKVFLRFRLKRNKKEMNVKHFLRPKTYRTVQNKRTVKLSKKATLLLFMSEKALL